MKDMTQITVIAADAPRGDEGERLLTSAGSVAMRLWDRESAGEPKPAASRPYDTVGYVIAGRARLELGGRAVELAPGTSYVVPRDVEHTYTILETLTAVEATSPPAGRRG